MPSRNIHNKINKLILGQSYNNVNKFMDAPVKIYGKKHRKYFHSPKDALLIGVLFKDSSTIKAALLHQFVDKTFPKGINGKLLKLILK